MTGELSVLQYFKNNIGGTDRLDASRSVEVSRDGKYVYVAARFYDAGINVFSRNEKDGELNLVAFDSLAKVSAMRMAPDGKHLYVTSTENNTIEAFAIDHQTGGLHLVQTRHDSMRTDTNMDWAGTMTFSPDGLQLYLNDEERLLIYTRDPGTGLITPVQKVNSRDYELGQLISLTVSPDGAQVYWNSVRDTEMHSIATFHRDSLTGELTFLSKQEVNRTYPSGALAIKISPDGRHIYAAMQENVDDYFGPEAAVGVFARDMATGKLSYIETITFPDWCEIRDLVISSNGLDVYALASCPGSLSGLLVMLERDPLTGRLTVRERFESWQNGVYGMFSPTALSLSPDERYIYVADLGGVGTFATGRDNSTGVETQVGDQTRPQAFALHPNHPNPFNPTTLIKYDLPKATHVTITICDVLGRRVRTLVDELMDAGYHSQIWDGKNDKGIPVASGIYFYRLHSPEFTKVRKMMVLQ